MTKKKQASGYARSKAAGRHVVAIEFTPAELALVDEATKLDQRPRAAFVRIAAVNAAIKFLKDAGKT